jgi:hypothetical protein
MSDEKPPAPQDPRPGRHPFRPAAVARYERPLSGYAPELKPRRPWGWLAAGVVLLIGISLWR